AALRLDVLLSGAVDAAIGWRCFVGTGLGGFPGTDFAGSAELTSQRATEASADDFLHAQHVVVAKLVLDLESAVRRPFWLPVLEDDHARDLVGPLDVRHVVALDPIG